MYESQFHLDRRPFAATPDPGCCYQSPTQATQLQNVVRCVEQGRGIAILTGPAGIGKTLLAQVLLAELQPRFTGVYLGTGQFPTRRALLQAILYELGQPYGGMTDQELRLELSTALRNLITQKDGLLLVLDEAHLLSDRLLEEVRMLVDLAQQGVPLVRVVLCGNPELEERLISPALSAFNQRVACHESIETLLRAESISYLEYRVHWAGGDAHRLFEFAAMELIAVASDGVPRCLNQLADHSLTQAFLAGATIATEETVRESLSQLQRLPLRWNASALLSRSWNSKSDVESVSQVTPQASSAQSYPDAKCQDSFQSESTVASIDGESDACFEFGAGDGTYESARQALPDDRALLQIEQPPRPGIPSVTSEFIESALSESEAGNSSVPETQEFETLDSESGLFETGTPADVVQMMNDATAAAHSEGGLAVSQADTAEATVDDFEPQGAVEFGAGDDEAERDFGESGDDENQPHFAWLAHPAAHSEPLVETGKNQPAPSIADRFKMPLKLRVGAVVESRQIGGRENAAFESVMHRGGKLADQFSDVASAIDEPVEEVIVDRYAALDADCRPAAMRASSRVRATNPQRNQEVQGLSDVGASATQLEVTQPAAHCPEKTVTATAEVSAQLPETPVATSDQSFAGNPLGHIESLCALLETADDSASDEHRNAGVSVELITDWGVERVDVDLSAETNLPTLPGFETQSPLSIDDWIGSTVVDVGRNLQPRPAEALPSIAADPGNVKVVDRENSESDISPTVELPRAEIERTSQFDIVEPDNSPVFSRDSSDYRVDSEYGSNRNDFSHTPESDAPESESSIPGANARVTTSSSFHNLFSTLRRRKATT